MGTMNCREFERRLDEIVQATAPQQTLREAALHRGSCAACRDLEQIARASLAVSGSPEPDLTQAVMSLTSGPACGPAGERLADLVDGRLAGIERELLVSHLSGCDACRGLAATMRWMSAELAALAEIDPGAGFTAEVLRATTRRRRPQAGVAAALRDWCSALIARPRFTWEAAYAGALMIWLLFGAGFSPFRDVPGHALDMARVNPVRVIEDRVQPASVGHEVWEATGGRMLESAEESTTDWSGRTKRLKGAWVSFASHGSAMVGSAFRGDLSGSAVRLKDMGADLRLIWNELRQREVEKKPKAQEA